MKLSDKEWRVLNALWVAPEGLALGAVVDALRPDTGWSRSTVLAYQGSAGKLVAAFLKDEKLTPQERDELRKLLDEMEV